MIRAIGKAFATLGLMLFEAIHAATTPSARLIGLDVLFWLLASA